MLNSLDMGRMESVLNSQDEWCAAQLCSPSAMLLAPLYLLYNYVIRERIRSGSRSSRKPPKQKYVYICLFWLDGFSDWLHCAASPAAL